MTPRGAHQPSDLDAQIRDYLAAVVDPAIKTDQALFATAKIEIFDNPAARLDPSVHLFDEEFYLARRVRCQPGLTPLRDFFAFGAHLGLSPHPMLQPEYLAAQFDDVSLGGATSPDLNVLTAFIRADGAIAPNLFFDADVYRACVRRSGRATGSLARASDAVFHYLRHWRDLQNAGHLAISSFFDPYFYNMLAARQGFELVDPLSHYLSKLPADRTDCNSRFDHRYYRAKWGVLFDDCLAHFITVGAGRAHLPNPYADQELGLQHMTAPAEVIEQLLLGYVRLKSRAA